eukprot:CAMPEP_0183292400 /NCGR_PEP_ID=MMETSP0160_2-20130417/1471_1 /TAXON_ID=2839 ORGANISM="Odontella Sinensis, Strain Grunow 1884" /NCGR_SAMPLE_ID=MMETSP0160_2 /ASSEMBLY_ACC=CAM_ASM_000250 /LENGTH=347 /DNA_ID=CAMNT_0025453343 /DNA_START=110 /DNA_END=1150 /DNA_ORIENTATION=+
MATQPACLRPFALYLLAFSSVTLTEAQPPPSSLFAPEWTSSLPFLASFSGEIVRTQSGHAIPGGIEERTPSRAEIGISASATGPAGSGSAFHHIQNDLSLDKETQNSFGARNDYEVTHFDGIGGAMRMVAKQCPPESGDVQLYEDSTNDFASCQCSIEITESPVGGCTLPTKFSCLPWESCVPTEDAGCPLSEFVQRRSWGYAPPSCEMRPLESYETDIVDSALPWTNDTEFVVCDSSSAYSGQTEAVRFEEGDPHPGIPAYDLEVYCNPSHQGISCTSYYLVGYQTTSPSTPGYASLLSDPAGFLDCLGSAAIEEASKVLCNGQGTMIASPGSDPYPFTCDCNPGW